MIQKLAFLTLVFSASLFGGSREHELIEHVKRCIALAERHQSGLGEDVLAVQGMTSPKIRHFLNNLCSLPNTSYLEIGCWKGATLLAALYGNAAFIRHAVAIDNWSGFEGRREEFWANIQRFLPERLLYFYEQDCFAISLASTFPIPVNVYFYDGDHSALSQEKAFTFFNDILDDVFIAVVDDWIWDCVQEGTFAAFSKLNYEVCFQQAMFVPEDQNEWWNGLFVAVIKKPTSAPRAAP